MDPNKIDMFLIANGKKFPANKLEFVRQRLYALPPEKENLPFMIGLKDPTMILIMSILLGGWGIDRFMIGDIGLGIGKLLTAGGCGIWAIIDWFLIQDATREKNFQEFMMALG
ncbi:MAG: TM2 domain-containing protein [Bacteroidaceae bacterium]|nr:TM2 domain-containing protein [Bacteroidaceae bacterium]